MKQAVGGVPADSQQNAVFYSDADLLPCAAVQNLPKFAGSVNNFDATDTNIRKLTKIPVTVNQNEGKQLEAAAKRGCCADCGCPGVRNLLDPPFSPKNQPQDLPTPMSEVVSHKQSLDLGDNQKVSKSATQKCKSHSNISE